MPATFFNILEFANLLIAAATLFGLRSVIRQTTLTTVWPWIWAPWAGAVAGWFFRINGNPALVTYMDYFTAVAMLSPPLASLGARRPTCRSWPLFVLLPMFAVLLWPAVSVGLATRFGRPLELERPAIVMYLVVLIMGMGNYGFGRCGLSVAMLSGCLASQVSGVAPLPKFFAPDHFRLFTEWMAIAVCLHLRDVPLTAEYRVASPGMKSGRLYWPSSKIILHRDPFDAILDEFGELYGLVWSLRMQDRLNVFAEQQKWPGRFEGRRGHWTAPLTDAQRGEIKRAFRWLFRRFVDPEWLDVRLNHSGTAVAEEALNSPIDS